MPFPSNDALEKQLLIFIFKNGGRSRSVKAAHTYSPLAVFFSLTREEINLTRDEKLNDSRSEPLWNNKVQWARASLKDKGHLASAPRGVWALSEAGVQAAEAELPLQDLLNG